MHHTTGSARPMRLAIACAALLALSGCETLALMGLGVGTSTAVNHTLTGITYRTFTAPMPRVKTASISALKRMGIHVGPTEKTDGNEVLKGTAKDR